MAKVVVVYSGGMDSRTVLQKAMHEGHDVHLLTMDYGQRHWVEVNMAAQVASKYDLPFKIVELGFMPDIADSSTLLNDKDMPQGHYEEESMKDTVVPNRNMLLLSVAIAYAVNINAPQVWYGAHGGDHAIYPDCRPEFLDAINNVAAIANWDAVEVVAPFMHTDKAGILSYGLDHDVDYSKTWTCYDPQPGKPVPLACGKCGSCQERLEAFALNNKTDPLEYANVE